MTRFLYLTVTLILATIVTECAFYAPSAQKRAERLVTQHLDSLWAEDEYERNWHALEFTQLDTVYFLSDTMAIHKQEIQLRRQVGFTESMNAMVGFWGSAEVDKTELEKLAKKKQEIMDTYSEDDIKYLTIGVHVEWDTPLGKIDNWREYKLDPEVTRVLGLVK